MKQLILFWGDPTSVLNTVSFIQRRLCQNTFTSHSCRCLRELPCLRERYSRFDAMHPAVLAPHARQFIVAFGGGALVSAVALVLIPDGTSKLSTAPATLCFAAGGAFFYGLERYLSRLESSAGQLVAMLSDFIPEAIALGTAFAVGESTGLILALLMVLQNLFEGFNACQLPLGLPSTTRGGQCFRGR